MTIPNIHDATLTRIEIDLNAGSVRLYFAGSPYGPHGPFSVSWQQVREFHTTRNEPWGPSSSVLETRLSEPGKWHVIMQSGDEVVICGDGPTLDALTESGG